MPSTTVFPSTDDVLGRLVAPREQRTPRGAMTLDQTRAFYAQFFAFPSSAHLDAFTLWAAMTHMRNPEGEFVGQTAPRCIIRADVAGAGKSLLGRLAELTIGNGNLVSLPSYWGVVRGISERNQTVIVDNYDTIRRGRSDILNLLLIGAYKHTAEIMRGKQGEEELDVFGPMAITAVGRKLRVDSDFAPVLERSIVIDVEKKADHVQLDEFDNADPQHMSRALGIRAALARWGQDVAAEYQTMRPALPLHNRERDMWRPLVAVAELAGGDWPDRADRALRVLVLGEAVAPAADDDPFARLTPAERTMVEVAHAFRQAGEPAHLSTVDLLARMATLPGGKRWSVPELGDDDRTRVLRSRTMSLSADLDMFGVVRSSVKVPMGEGRSVNGWHWSDIRDNVPTDLPTFRPSDLVSDENEDEVPFD
jgi:hypothetical protein